MNLRPFVIAGPCALESVEDAYLIAQKLKMIGRRLDVEIVFKASFDKANRLSLASGRGLGLDSLTVLFDRVRNQFGLRTLTDIHECWQAELVAKVTDVIQIPAMLSRQTDLLLAAAETGRIVNIKKGQFLAPEDLESITKKVQVPSDRVWLTERGTSFGYRELVVDMRALPIMRALGHKVIFDATHSVQQPGGKGFASSGNRAYVPYLARAAAAVGVDGFFFEVHPDPNNAVSDGPNMIPLAEFEHMLEGVLELWTTAAKSPVKPFEYSD